MIYKSEFIVCNMRIYANDAATTVILTRNTVVAMSKSSGIST